MTRFTSTLAIAAVSLGLIGGFGLTQPAFAATAGSVDKAESGEKASVDKGADQSSADKGDRSKETETETSDASDR